MLDRAQAQEQLYPAIDVHRTGTRKEERLYSASEMAHLAALRRTLADYPSRQALTHLLKLLAQYPTNTKLLRHFTTRINPRAGY